MEREPIKNSRGVIVGELTPDGDGFEVWRRERLRYPARRRRVLLGRCDSIESGRDMLLAHASTPAKPAGADMAK